jgi:hypothetical protein
VTGRYQCPWEGCTSTYTIKALLPSPQGKAMPTLSTLRLLNEVAEKARSGRGYQTTGRGVRRRNTTIFLQYPPGYTSTSCSMCDNNGCNETFDTGTALHGHKHFYCPFRSGQTVFDCELGCGGTILYSRCPEQTPS